MTRSGTLCVISEHIVRLTLAGERNCGYKGVQVSDPRAKQWLADDANFLASLGDLDRGLGGTGPGARDDAEIVTTATHQASAPAPHARVDSSAAAPPSAPSAAPIESRPRPLLDLFPESALMPQSSASGSAGIPASPAPPGRGSTRLAGSMMRGQQASAEVIDRAPAEGPGLLGRLLIVTVFALLVLVGAGGALWASRDAVNRTILQWEQMPLPPGGPVRQLSVPIAPIPPPDVDALR